MTITCPITLKYLTKMLRSIANVPNPEPPRPVLFDSRCCYAITPGDACIVRIPHGLAGTAQARDLPPDFAEARVSNSNTQDGCMLLDPASIPTAASGDTIRADMLWRINLNRPETTHPTGIDAIFNKFKYGHKDFTEACLSAGHADMPTIRAFLKTASQKQHNASPEQAMMFTQYSMAYRHHDGTVMDVEVASPECLPTGYPHMISARLIQLVLNLTPWPKATDVYFYYNTSTTDKTYKPLYIEAYARHSLVYTAVIMPIAGSL